MKITRRQIQAADFVEYNANASGNHAEDCVKRSISLAFDMPYQEVGKLLVAEMKKSRYDTWTVFPVYGKVIEALGGSNYIDIANKGLNLGEFVDDWAEPGKAYVVLVGRTEKRHDHAVCVRDGKVWDSWDSRKQYVHGYYEVDASSYREIQDLSDLVKGDFQPLCEKAVLAEIQRYATRKKMDIKINRIKTWERNNYQIKVNVYVTLPENEVVTKVRNYSFDVIFVFTPTMTEDEALEYIKKIGKQRTYDRMYSITDQEKKLREEYEIAAKAQHGKKTGVWLKDDREAKFYRSLPGWLKPLLTYINVFDPGQYNDSYEVVFYPHPDDDRHAPDQKINLYDYTSRELKQQLDRYRETWELPGEDYEKDW